MLLLYLTQSRVSTCAPLSRHRLTNPSVYELSEIPWASRTELKWTSLGALEDGEQFKLSSRATFGENLLRMGSSLIRKLCAYQS